MFQGYLFFKTTKGDKVMKKGLIDKVILSIIVLCSPLFAGASDANYISDFGIFVYGDVQSIENAFILVQAIAKSDIMTYFLTLVALYSIPYSSWNLMQTKDWKKFLANTTFMIASVLSIEAAQPDEALTTTVHIEDLRAETNYSGLPDKTYAKVDGIPFPISFVASVISTSVDGIKTEFEDAIQVVNVARGLDIEG